MEPIASSDDSTPAATQPETTISEHLSSTSTNEESQIAPLPLPPLNLHEVDPPIPVKPIRASLRPIKSILKAPVVTPSRFNFKRDILQTYSRLYAAADVAAGSSSPSYDTSNAGDTINEIPVAGGFWGSAIKKLSVATVGAGVAIVRGVGEPLVGELKRASGVGSSRHASSDGGGANVHSLAAPHTPSARGIPTSSVASTSSIATIRSSASPKPVVASLPPLSIVELKKVRFRMATLKVIYPINNGSSDSITPSEEGLTKKR
jgi:protein phosphatase 1 regulatory subunit 37